MKARNVFGNWSDSVWTAFYLEGPIAHALSCADGSDVTISGIVTAVFADCSYLQEDSGVSAIRLQGYTSSPEGTRLTISGKLTTIKGGRALIPEK